MSSSHPVISVVIPTFPGRTTKLQALLSDISSTKGPGDEYEVVLVVDAEDEGPLRLAEQTLTHVPLQGFTQQSKGPAAARNRGVKHAKGTWILFFDDDARVNSDTLPAHLEYIMKDPHSQMAYLGSVHWPEKQMRSAWGQLLSQSSMLFFRDKMSKHERYGFRHFWTSNLSVRRDCVLEVGGFDETFPYAMHEDIELGFRLSRRFGMNVVSVPEIQSWHDHELSPRDYFCREHRSGQVAQLAGHANPIFFKEVWPWIGRAQEERDLLHRLFFRGGSEIKQLLEHWNQSDASLSSDEIRMAYHAHIPLKRLFFYEGYLGGSFEKLWNAL